MLIAKAGAISAALVGTLSLGFAADPSPPLHEQIDAVLGQGVGAFDAGLCPDADFLRRVSLDLRGIVPDAAEVRAFLADPAADKRTRCVDAYLADPQHQRHLVTLLDVLLMERRAPKNVKVEEWRQWLVATVAARKPWDQLVGDLLAADGAEDARRGAARWLLDRDAEPHALTRDAGRIFLGMDLACAQCHDHPRIADYWQRDYYGLFAFFNRTYLFQPDPMKPAFVGERADGEVDWSSVFTKISGQTKPCVPGGTEVDEPAIPAPDQWTVPPNDKDKAVRPVPKYSRRARLAGSLVGTRAFALNAANRWWAALMGRGVVDPVDLHHSANPPSADRVLDVLADGLVAMKYDLDGFMREIALSRSYQRPFDPPSGPAVAPVDATALEAARTAAADAERACQQAEDALRDVWKPKKLAAQAIDAEAKAAAAAVAESQKAVDAAAAALAKAVAPLAARRDLAQTLEAASARCAQAAGIVTDAPELAKAAALLKARFDQTSAEVAAVEKDAAAKTAELDGKKVALAATQQKAVEIEPRLTAARTEAGAAWVEVAAAATRSRAARETARGTSRDADRAQSIVVLNQATAVLEQNRHQLASGQQSAEAVAGALSKAQEACQKLPDDQELATVIAQVKTRSEQTGLQVVAQRSAVEAAEAARQTATSAIVPRWSDRFALARLTPLSPEQLCWSMLRATGALDPLRAAATKEWDDKHPQTDANKADPAWPEARRAGIDALTAEKVKPHEDQFVRLFGNTAGSPQTDFFATADQALYFENAGSVRSWTQPGSGTLADRMIKLPDAAALADELYLSVLNRPPTADETAETTRLLAARPEAEKAAVVSDLIWALLTSLEFRFKH